MVTPRSDEAIVIAGGGIGGLSAAIALARDGEPVRLFERAEKFSEAGAGIQLGPNATRVLRSWGVLDRLRPHAVAAEGIGIGNGENGNLIARVRLGDYAEERYGAPYLLVHRADLHNALLSTLRATKGATITMGTEVTGYDQIREDVIVKTSNMAARGRALVAADGLWSTLRPDLSGFGQPVFTEKTAWRALVDPQALPEELQGPWTGLWLSPYAHLVHYPVNGGKAINVVAVITERWMAARGWDLEADPGQLLPVFGKWDPRLRHILESAGGWRKWALYDLPPLRRWTRGTATLLGDAAHPVTPFLAQGGAMAIEDAAILARQLRRHDGDAVEAFYQYEYARIERTARMRYESRRMGGTYHMSGLFRRARDFVLRRKTPEALLERFDWLYGFDALDQDEF